LPLGYFKNNAQFLFLKSQKIHTTFIAIARESISQKKKKIFGLLLS